MKSFVRQFTVPGVLPCTSPITGTVDAFLIGGGEAGANFDSGANGGGGGGAGGSAHNAAVAVTQGVTYNLVVGAGGTPDYRGAPAALLLRGPARAPRARSPA